MKRIIICVIILISLLSITAYAKDDYLHITMDLSTNNVSIDSDQQIATYFSANDFVKNVGNDYLFIFSYNSEADFDDFKLKIALPEKAIVSEMQGTLLLSRPVQISTNGRRIYLEWSTELAKNDQFTTFAQYRENTTETNYYLISVIILIIIAFFTGYGFKRFRKEKFIKAVLSEDEKKIITIIKKDLETTQDDLKRHLNWSKTKTSKVIRNLEIKNMIIKIPHKKTNKIKLK